MDPEEAVNKNYYRHAPMDMYNPGPASAISKFIDISTKFIERSVYGIGNSIYENGLDRKIDTILREMEDKPTSIIATVYKNHPYVMAIITIAGVVTYVTSIAAAASVAQKTAPFPGITVMGTPFLATITMLTHLLTLANLVNRYQTKQRHAELLPKLVHDHNITPENNYKKIEELYQNARKKRE